MVQANLQQSNLGTTKQSMKDKQSSLIFIVVLLYAALTIVMGLGFGIDIAGWWALPVYEGLSSIIHGITGFFR